MSGRAFRVLVAVFALLVGAGPSGATGSTHPPTPAGWFHVYPLDKHTFAISEPQYWQQNVSYLLIGSHRALLFDTGPGLYSIRGEVERLTSLPVVVIPSHLHFDHVGDLEEFSDVRLLDTPALRAQMRDGYFEEALDQYMVRSSFQFRVHGWIRDGQLIELGGRRVRILATPGHTPDSVSLIENGKRLYTGDLVNRVVSLYAVPGSDAAAAATSLQRVLRLAQPDALAYEAHAEAPLKRSELVQLANGIAAIADGRITVWTRVCLGATPMRHYLVGPFPVLLALPGGPEQPPFASATETVDFDAGACP
jgi:glyoxylase-like metal-dependent hydrolase (beta-lactamase superfamily II)